MTAPSRAERVERGGPRARRVGIEALRDRPGAARRRAAVRGRPPACRAGGARLHGSSASKPAMRSSAVAASPTERASTETQSRPATAGTTPARAHEPARRLEPDDAAQRGRAPGPSPRCRSRARCRPRRRRPRPPSPSSTRRRCDRASAGCGTRRTASGCPTSPVANWSRFVLPTTIAPASTSACTAGALAAGCRANAGMAGGGREPGDVDVVLHRDGPARDRLVAA